MISINDLTKDVKYFGTKQGDGFVLIGYVDMKHNDTLVFHSNLTQRTFSEVEGMTAEQIQALADNEATEILSGDCAVKCINEYIGLFNLGLYGA
ncbi:MAG: hypothetical protein Q8936_23925 [Bacillota bacterium]|nr:hypothetical protein [Bacillota bacterium]